jgi:DNA-binding response OmpR family regulator
MSTSQSADEVGLSPRGLRGLRILVVEDDYLIAQEIATTLREHGATVMGPVGDVTGSRALLMHTTPDCALLDVNLKGQFVFELAEELVRRDVPPIFTTGYDCSFLPAQFREVPCLLKPIDMRRLVSSIREQTTRERFS